MQTMVPFSKMEYTRPDFESYKTQYLELLKDFQTASSADSQSEVMIQMNELSLSLGGSQALATARYQINTKDEFYANEQDYLDEVNPLFGELSMHYSKALITSPFRADLERRWGKQLFTGSELYVKVINADVVEDLQRENALCTEYSKLLASAEIEFDGKTLNLAGMSPYMQDIDRDTRRSASEATFAFYSANAEQLDRIYDQLVHLRTSIAHTLKFPSFTELGYARMGRSDYDASMVATYRSYVHKYIVPIATRLRERQRQRLGVDTLMSYDEGLMFKSGNPTPKGDPDWIVARAKEMYNEMSPETSEFFNFLCQYELMDLVNKPNKAGGGFCMMIDSYRAPFIFSNFNGTTHDVDVLTHEAGHAFQAYMSRTQPLSNYFWATSEASEIHSMSMEFFAWKWMKSFFKEDEDKYQFKHLSGALLFLPYGVTVDEFQHFVYANPTATPAERKQAWLQIDKKYDPTARYDGIPFLEGGGQWQAQKHIYEMPFYYIDYTLAQVCALQFWVRMKTDRPGAWADYVTLCKAGGSKPFLELVELAGLHSPFEEQSFVSIVDDITARLDGIDDAIFD